MFLFDITRPSEKGHRSEEYSDNFAYNVRVLVDQSVEEKELCKDCSEKIGKFIEGNLLEK